MSPPRKKKSAPRTKVTLDLGKRTRFAPDVPVFDRGQARLAFKPTGLDDFDDSDEERQFDSDFGDPSFHGKD